MGWRMFCHSTGTVDDIAIKNRNPSGELPRIPYFHDVRCRLFQKRSFSEQGGKPNRAYWVRVRVKPFGVVAYAKDLSDSSLW